MKTRKISLHNKSLKIVGKIADDILSFSNLLPEPAFLSMKDKVCFDLKRSFDHMPDTIAIVVIVMPGADTHYPDNSPFGNSPNLPSHDPVDYGIHVEGQGIPNPEKARVLELAKKLGCKWALEIS